MKIIDILEDVRNERTPQWADSDYACCMVYISAGINVSCAPSNYEDLAIVWDGLNAKKAYNLHDTWFTYVPNPSLLNMLLLTGRGGWTGKLTGLLTKNLLFIDGWEPRIRKTYVEGAPEIWEYIIEDMKKRGVATPRQVVNCTPPNLKDKKSYKNEKFRWKYDNSARIKPFDWGLTEEEVFGGILTDITLDTPEEKDYGEAHIISTGIGIDTIEKK
jgi:hypothetical protein